MIKLMVYLNDILCKYGYHVLYCKVVSMGGNYYFNNWYFCKWCGFEKYIKPFDVK